LRVPGKSGAFASLPGLAAAKELLGFFEKALANRALLPVAQLGKLTEFVFLGGVELRGNLDVDADMQITMPVSLYILYSMPLQTEDSARLSTGRNLDQRAPVQGWDFNLRAESGLDKTDRNFAEQVVAVPLKNLVRPDMQDDVEVS
jgi:hypothetical protein